MYDISDIEQKREKKKHGDYEKLWEGSHDCSCFPEFFCGNMENAQETVSFPLKKFIGTFLVVQWLRLCAPTAGGTSSITGQGTKIPLPPGMAKNK